MSVAKRVWRGWVIAPALACTMVVGCSDGDEGGEARDGGPDVTGDRGDGGVTNPDGGVDMDGGARGPQLPNATAQKLDLANGQNDRLAAVVFGTDGKIYAAGYVRSVEGGVTDQRMAVARFTTDGTLDPTFGTAGIATINANAATASAPDTTEAARGLALATNGSVLVTGVVPKGAKVTLGMDEVDQLDVAVARLTSTGQLDTAYATGSTVPGVRVLDLGPTIQHPVVNAMGMTTQSTINDDAAGIAIDAMGRAVVFASGKAEGTRTDRDRYIVRLTPEGVLDTTFATDGMYTWDPSKRGLNDNAKPGHVLAGNKIFSPGYTNIDTKNHITLLQLNENGTEDTGFNMTGEVVVNPLGPAGMAEAYGAARQSSGNYVTAGYGNEGQPPQRIVSFRFTPAGVRDTSYGTAGGVIEDIQAESDQARAIAALPDDRLLLVGNSNTAQGVSDAFVLLLSKDGQRDPSLGGQGHQVYDLGNPSEQLTSVAVSPDGRFAVAVGYSSGGQMGPDDSVLWVQPLGD